MAPERTDKIVTMFSVLRISGHCVLVAGVAKVGPIESAG